MVSVISCQNDDQQQISIHLNEESPLSTILFTTTNNITYRLFDSGRNQNSFISYNTSTGHILLSHALDREDLCARHICSCSHCQLMIELIEWQIPYRLLQLILNLEDINDQRPRFSSDHYQLNIMENIPIGLELPLEAAQDDDLGDNGRISYELQSSSNGPFQLITKLNGGVALKVIREIDREEQDFYQYQINAYDHGQPRQESSTNLSISIDDMNDNPVLLSQTYIHLHLSENTPVGTELTCINATDKDIGINGKIHYSISNGYPIDHFRIGDANGILTLVNALDYETEQSYRLTIQVRDLGENSLARFVTIDISIVDENDNSPQAFVTFVQPLLNDSVISLVESTPIGQILAHISISDQDSGDNGDMSYAIEQGGELIGIRILDERSFLLIINHLIDREAESSEGKKFILIIADHGKPSKSVRLEYPIRIVDLNDSPPRFNPSRKCDLHLDPSNNRSLDQPLFRVQAVDADLGENGRISYSILPPYDHSFLVNDQGEIFHLENFNNSFYRLQIMAIDHGENIRLNSTYDCLISISRKDSQQRIQQPTRRAISKYNYFVLVLILILCLIIIGLVLCFYKFIFHHRRCFQPNKTYHLYVSIPRKSLYIDDSSPSDHGSEEFVHLNSDQSSEKDSLASHHQFPRIVGSLHSSMQCSDASRPVSMSISTATTLIHLAEEEKMDV